MRLYPADPMKWLHEIDLPNYRLSLVGLSHMSTGSTLHSQLRSAVFFTCGVPTRQTLSLLQERGTMDNNHCLCSGEDSFSFWQRCLPMYFVFCIVRMDAAHMDIPKVRAPETNHMHGSWGRLRQLTNKLLHHSIGIHVYFDVHAYRHGHEPFSSRKYIYPSKLCKFPCILLLPWCLLAALLIYDYSSICISSSVVATFVTAQFKVVKYGAPIKTILHSRSTTSDKGDMAQHVKRRILCLTIGEPYL